MKKDVPNLPMSSRLMAPKGAKKAVAKAAVKAIVKKSMKKK
jgi:hypothetical protein